MSRIAGVIGRMPRTHQAEIVADLFRKRIRGSAEAHTEGSLGGATLGWAGVGEPSLLVRDRVLAVVDGVFYNSKEFDERGTSEASILITLYQRWGMEKAISLINGDFATALYDEKDDCLWLGRDRFGVKPLYYSVGPTWLFFASRHYPIATRPEVGTTVNRRFTALIAGSHYRTFDNDLEATPFQKVAQLPGSNLLFWKNGSVRKTRYWTLEDSEDFSESDLVLADRYRSLLMDAVDIRLKKAERPAFTLSGGMDSSSVLASAVHLRGGKRQHAFSTTYVDKTYDETEEIRSMLSTAVEKWHVVPVDPPNILELVDRMVGVNEEPVPTATWLSHFLLCEAAAKEGFGSLFGGLGGDELNAGEYEYFFFHFADLRREKREVLLAEEVRFWALYHDHPVFRKDQSVMEEGMGRLVDLGISGQIRTDRRRLNRYASTIHPQFYDLSVFDPILDHPFKSYLKNRTYQDLFRETIPCCLRTEDRQTEAFGLSHFLPFLDYRLAEFMFKVPGRLKIRDGITKRLLRDAMAGLLPEETRTRIKKTGWNAPAHIWFSGQNRGPLLDLIHSRSFQDRGIYNLREVTRIVDEHDEIVASGKPVENHMMFIWQLVNLEMWLRSINRASSETWG